MILADTLVWRAADSFMKPVTSLEEILYSSDTASNYWPIIFLLSSIYYYFLEYFVC